MAAYALSLHAPGRRDGFDPDLFRARASLHQGRRKRRLPALAQAASCTVEAKLAALLASAVIVPADAVLLAGATRFTLDADFILAPGETTAQGTHSARGRSLAGKLWPDLHAP